MATWKNYELDLKDYEIFLVLKKNPLQSNAAIAKEVGLSSETVRIRILNMKKRGFLRATRKIQDPLLGARLQTDTEARVSPSSINLIRQHVIFKAIPDRTSLNLLKKLCDEHPYTRYRSVAYADGASLYVQFDLPPSTINTMSKLYSELQKHNLFKETRIQNTTFLSKCETNLIRWNLSNGRWFMESEEKASRRLNQSRFEKTWSRYLENGRDTKLREQVAEGIVSQDELDMKLLRELTINSQPNTTQLGKVYEKDPTTIARRLQKLRESVVAYDMLYYDRRAFDLTYPQITIGKFRSGSDMTSLTINGFVESGLIPFEFRVVSDKDSFLVYSTTPPSMVSELSEFFWEHADDVHIYQLQPIGSYQYFFYHENYLGDGKWRTDDEYVVSTPLASLRLK